MEGRRIRKVTGIGLAAWLAGLTLLVCLTAACRITSSDDDGSGMQTAVIGPEGGVVEVTDPGSAICGARVYIPSGALDSEQNISLSSIALPADLSNGYLTAGRCIEFQPDGIRFLKPVLLYLPYADANNDGIIDGRAVRENDIGVLYYNSLAGRWEEMPLHGTDTGNNLAVVEAEHFSAYLVHVDPSDALTLDPGPVYTGTAPLFEPGECFLGDDQACHYAHLTLLRRVTGWTAIVDRNLTYVQSGNIATISEDGTSAVFDAVSAFSKVLASGDATQWSWECEFVSEYTFLSDYEVMEDDALSPADAGGAGGGTDTEGIFCRIEAVDANMVKITWQINAFEQVLYQTTPEGNGHCLAIRFRATHQ